MPRKRGHGKGRRRTPYKGKDLRKDERGYLNGKSLKDWWRNTEIFKDDLPK